MIIQDTHSVRRHVDSENESVAVDSLLLSGCLDPVPSLVQVFGACGDLQRSTSRCRDTGHNHSYWGARKCPFIHVLPISTHILNLFIILYLLRHGDNDCLDVFCFCFFFFYYFFIQLIQIVHRKEKIYKSTFNLDFNEKWKSRYLTTWSLVFVLLFLFICFFPQERDTNVNTQIFR